MSLQRTAIRVALLEQLKSQILGVSSWNHNRFRPIWEKEEIPAISVYTISEQAEKYAEAPRRMRKRLQIAVEIIVQADEKSDEKLDYLCGAVENAIYSDETLKCTVSDTMYVSTEIIEKVDGQFLTGAAIMVFEAQYYEYAPSERALPDFKGGDFKFVYPEGTDVTEGKFNVDPNED